MNDDATYRAFLLRAWRVDNGGVPVWRYSLQAAGDATIHVFRVASELVMFLETEGVEEQSEPSMEDREQ